MKIEKKHKKSLFEQSIRFEWYENEETGKPYWNKWCSQKIKMKKNKE